MKKPAKSRRKQPPEAELLSRINRYLDATGAGPTAWGIAAMGDAKFIQKLEKGQKIRVKTRERVESALAADWARIAELAPPGLFRESRRQ